MYSPCPLFLLSVRVSRCVCARACIFSDIVSLPDLSGRASRSSQLTDSLFVRVCVCTDTGMFFPPSLLSVSPGCFYDFVSLLISSLRLVACFFFTHTLTDSTLPTTHTHPQTHLQVCSGCLSVSLQFVAVSNINQLKAGACKALFLWADNVPLKYLVFIVQQIIVCINSPTVLDSNRLHIVTSV